MFPTSPVVRLRSRTTKLRRALPETTLAQFDLASPCPFDKFVTWHPVDDGKQGGAARWAGAALALSRRLSRRPEQETAPISTNIDYTSASPKLNKSPRQGCRHSYRNDAGASRCTVSWSLASTCSARATM